MYELEYNRVWRPFVGGKLLDEFCGIAEGKDGHYPERWICSTTKTADGKGVSKTKDGSLLTDIYKKPVNVLVKLLDSYTRLMIQVHPDDKKAQKYFDSRFGKTECWYILNTRVINGVEPYVYLGFKKGVTRQKWEELFKKQDIKGMEECLNKITVKKGDAFFIPGGVVHAMGSGVFFAEIQQPTDITLRTEWKSPDGRDVDEYAINCNKGNDVLFDCFDYTTYSEDELLKKYKLSRNGDIVTDNSLFWMKDVCVKDEYTVETDSYAIVVVLEGKDKGKEYFLTQNETFYGSQRLLICGSNM